MKTYEKDGWSITPEEYTGAGPDFDQKIGYVVIGPNIRTETRVTSETELKRILPEKVFRGVKYYLLTPTVKVAPRRFGSGPPSSEFRLLY